MKKIVIAGIFCLIAGAGLLVIILSGDNAPDSQPRQALPKVPDEPVVMSEEKTPKAGIDSVQADSGPPPKTPKAQSQDRALPDQKVDHRPHISYIVRGQAPDSIWDAFRESIENPHTTTIFKSLQHRFKADIDDLEIHFQEVRKYLLSQVDAAKVDKIMALYRKFTDYEVSLVEKAPAWGQVAVSSKAEAKELLDTIYQDKVAFFGNDTADALFGEEYRWQVFDMEKHEIVRNDALYGREKEDRIRELKKEIWGEGVNVSEMKSPMQRYEEKCRLYKLDLEKMSPEQRAETLKRFRHVTLPPAAARRLDAAALKKEQDQ